MNELQEMKEIHATLKDYWNNTDSWSIKSSLKKTMYDLQDKIRIGENRVNKKLDIVNIEGESVEIPEAVRKTYYSDKEGVELQYKEGVMYVIDKRFKYEENGSYHWNHYAWVKMSNSYVLLSIRTLGGDKYGARVKIEAGYFEHPADEYRYSKKYISSKSKMYEKYSTHILKELSLHNQ